MALTYPTLTNVNVVAWLWSSTELARVLAQLGKLQHAKATYVHVLEVHNGSSNSSLLRLLGLTKLRYAEVLALLGDVETRYVNVCNNFV